MLTAGARTTLGPIEAFKAAHKRPKRPRTSPKENQDQEKEKLEPSGKRQRIENYFVTRKLLEERLEQNLQDSFEPNLGKWLEIAEQRCIRVGNLTRRLELERELVLRKMSELQARGAQDVQQCDGLHSLQEAKGPDLKDENNLGKKSLQKGNSDYCLTSYSAWWKRMEKVERKFEREVTKENEERRKKRMEKEKKKQEKENFVKKFFPNSTNSPGGTFRLDGIISSRVSSVRKTGRAETPSTSTNISNTYNINRKIESDQTKEPSIRIFGGTILNIRSGRPDLNPPSESSHGKEAYKGNGAV